MYLFIETYNKNKDMTEVFGELKDELGFELNARTIHEREFPAQIGAQTMISFGIDVAADVGRKDIIAKIAEALMPDDEIDAFYLSFDNVLAVTSQAEYHLQAELEEHDNLPSAAQSGDLKAVIQFVEAGADIDAANAVEQYALTEALRQGHVAVAHYLIDQGANVNITSKQGMTPMKHALLAEDLILGKRLIEQGASIHTSVETLTSAHEQLPQPYTALQLAIVLDDFDMFKWLLNLGADRVGALDLIPDARALAERCGRPNMVRKLDKLADSQAVQHLRSYPLTRYGLMSRSVDLSEELSDSVLPLDEEFSQTSLGTSV